MVSTCGEFRSAATPALHQLAPSEFESQRWRVQCNLLRHPSMGGPSTGSAGVSGYSKAQVYRPPAPLLSPSSKTAFVNWHRRFNRRAFLNLHEVMIP
jgi:hypothetical protein